MTDLKNSVKKKLAAFIAYAFFFALLSIATVSFLKACVAEVDVQEHRALAHQAMFNEVAK